MLAIYCLVPHNHFIYRITCKYLSSLHTKQYVMIKAIKTLFACLIAANTLCAQQHLPADYLSPGFHRARREAFRQKMPANSVAVIFAYPERLFSNDVNYVYHQNPDMYYLSGYNEPNSVLLIFKNIQGGGDTAYNEVLFVRERNAAQETWTGRRLGAEGAKNKLGFARVYTGDQFKDFSVNFKSFAAILFDKIPVDMPNDGTGVDLAGLYLTFREKAGVKPRNESLAEIKKIIRVSATVENLERIISYFKIPELAKANTEISNDTVIQQVLAKPDAAKLAAIKQQLAAAPDNVEMYEDVITALRETKTPEELALIRKAAYISAFGHAEVMKAVTPLMSEREVEGIHRYIHAKYGAEEEGYPPILGAGANGCILHYEENAETRMDNQLLLMDVACEYHGYSADVTRTVPANGKFSAEQKAIYQLVYNAQDAAIKLCRAGVSFDEISEAAAGILAKGLMQLGIIKDEKELRKYYPHGLSHHIGLDVHDRGDYDMLKTNMVITVEPGIYIPAGSDCDKKWWNIGVRIEDDILITGNGYEILSAAAPRQWEDVEKMQAGKSPFKNFAAQPLP